MTNLKQTIQSKLERAQRVAILGVGSDLRGDDYSGILVAKQLQVTFGPSQTNLKIFLGGTAPENLTGEIKKFSPTHLVFIDSAENNKEPGTIMLIKEEEEVTGMSFSTHMMPLNLMVQYIKDSIQCEILLIGIQPKSIKFGDCVSKEVEKASKEVADMLKDIILEIRLCGH